MCTAPIRIFKVSTKYFLFYSHVVLSVPHVSILQATRQSKKQKNKFLDKFLVKKIIAKMSKVF